MKKTNENFNLYPLWDLNLPTIPPRSKLFPIQPIGAGTQEVESFTGYLNRLVQEHCVSPTTLLRYVFEQQNEVEPYKSFKEPYVARFLNGLNEWAYLINKFLLRLLPIEEIKYTTLLPLRNVLSKARLIRQKKLWCPLCLEEQKVKDKTIHEYLIWNIAVVEVCSIHKIPLINSCPTCNLQIVGASIMPYGFCRFCYSWLGYSNTDKAFKNAKFKRKPIHPKLLWIDVEVRKIAEFLPFAESNFTKENYKKGIVFLIKKFTDGNVSGFCRKLKIKEAELKKLLQKDALISINQLINICYPLNISPLDLLNGKTAIDLQHVEVKKLMIECKRIPHYPDLYLEKRPEPKTKKVKKEKIEAAEKIMIEALNKEIPPAFEEICRKVKINGAILKRILPELSQKLRDRYLEYKENEYKSRWQIEKI